MSLFTYNYYGLFVNTDTEYTDTSHSVEYTEKKSQKDTPGKMGYSKFIMIFQN